MFKRILTLLCFIIPLSAFATDQHKALIANIQYDWLNKSEMQKNEIINEIHDEIFKEPIVVRKDLKEQFKDRLKDKNHYENYMAASAGYEEFNGNYISAFYYKKMIHLYMYALQDKSDLTKSYYYDATGHLRYIDFIDGEFPDYPYYSIQYRINGTPVSAIYFVSKDCQYLLTPEGEFEGVWYKHKLYNKMNKVILTRTTY